MPPEFNIPINAHSHAPKLLAFSNVDNIKVAVSLECCVKCRSQRISEEQELNLQYFSAPIYVRKVFQLDQMQVVIDGENSPDLNEPLVNIEEDVPDKVELLLSVCLYLDLHMSFILTSFFFRRFAFTGFILMSSFIMIFFNELCFNELHFHELLFQQTLFSVNSLSIIITTIFSLFQKNFRFELVKFLSILKKRSHINFL